MPEGCDSVEGIRGLSLIRQLPICQFQILSQLAEGSLARVKTWQIANGCKTPDPRNLTLTRKQIQDDSISLKIPSILLASSTFYPRLGR